MVRVDKVCSILLALAIVISGVQGQAGVTRLSHFHGESGGDLRFPNSTQPIDANNAFGLAWAREYYDFMKIGSVTVSATAFGNIVGDSTPHPWNNSTTMRGAVNFHTRVGKHLGINVSVGPNWYREFSTGIAKTAVTIEGNYYYYRRFPVQDPHPAHIWGYHRDAMVLELFGNAKYPASLDPGDTNIVFSPGGILSTEFLKKNTKWQFVPFVDFVFSLDRDRKDYNNKIVLGAGVKFRYPIRHGKIFIGAKGEADRRWISNTTKYGVRIFAGWYRSW